MRRWARVWIGLCGLFAAALPALALDAQRAIRQLPHVWYENQLPQSTVLSIVQGADGALWLATYGGLARYSGAEFDVFDQRTAPVLRSSAITALARARDGTLWVGTLNGGLYRRPPQRDAFEEVALPAPAESVFGIAQDAAGALWLATNAGLARREGEGWRLYGAADGVALAPYRGLTGTRDGDVWVGLDGVGVLRRHGGAFLLLTAQKGLPSAQVYALEEDERGVLWVGTQHGLVRWDGSRFAADPRTAALAGRRIYALQGDRDGNLWIAVQERGLCRLAAQLECDDSLAGLGNDIVRAMQVDREGSLWIGTTNNGLHRLSDSKLVTVTGALESNSVRCVFEDAAGTLWVGTDGGGLARYADRTLVKDPRGAHLPSPFLRALAGAADGALWVGTIEGATRLGADGRQRDFRAEDGLPGAIVFALTPAARGGMWVGTTRGLARIDGERVSVVEATRGRDVRALYEAPDGRLWLGLRSGLACLRGEALDDCGLRGGAGTSVFAFLPAADGSLWLGTGQGLARWRDGRLIDHGAALDMHGDAVFSVLDDGRGQAWLSTNRGIARVAWAALDALDGGPHAGVAPQWFGQSDGMLSAQANGASQAPAWRSRDGRLWIGTAKGLVQVDPAHLRGNRLAPPVAIERVLVDGRQIDPYLAQAIGPGVDRLEFHYAGMSYVAPEAVRYRYRLEGYDRDWVDVGARRAAYYTNLPPGDYRFRAVASNNDGVWNEAGASWAVTIRPHWYETGVFRLGLALATLGLAAGAYRLRLWRLRANERALQREVAVRTQALQAANAELSRLASLDGLTRIANRGAFDAQLVQYWDGAAHAHSRLALLLCDIDDFKAYNDTYGHLAGDAALIRVADCLRRAAERDGGFAARYGGEELALLLPDCDADAALERAQAVLQAVRELDILHRSAKAASRVTVSIGVAACVPIPALRPQDLIAAADAALYRAKSLGRNRACLGEAAPGQRHLA